MKLTRNSPEEEAAIQSGIAADPDAPEWTTADFATAVRAQDMSEAQLDRMLPPAVAAAIRRRGPQKTPRKGLVTIRLDHDVAAHLRGTGKGWQSRANDLLRKAVGL